MSKPRLLDLFCGAGGAAMGYHRAGFEVVGVDIDPQPHYPFEFHQAGALEWLRAPGEFPRWRTLDAFDAIHASPPCQDYSKAMAHLAGDNYPRLIDPVRAALVEIGVPWVIENVVGAPLPSQSDLFGAHGVELCGTMFGLRVWRHRLFECSFPIEAPRGCNHSQPAMNPHNQLGRDRIYADGGRRDPEIPWREEMGVGWINKHEGREAIPPAYTEFIGEQLIRSVTMNVA
jgi:DNA (cytosine-5)-methyltransferase 1